MTSYNTTDMAVLEKNLLSGPAFARKQYADRIEELILAEKDSDVISVEYIYFKITGFRSDETLSGTMSYDDMLHDLSLLLERFSQRNIRSTNDVDDTLYTLKQLALILDVSPRTIQRWRKTKGLPAQHYVFPDKKKRVGIKLSVLKTFQKHHPELISRSADFSRITEREKSEIIKMLKNEMQGKNPTPTSATENVARKTGRAKESIRRIMHNVHFADQAAPFNKKLDEKDKMDIYRYLNQGRSTKSLAEQYHKSTQTIYRAYNYARAKKLLSNSPLSPMGSLNQKNDFAPFDQMSIADLVNSPIESEEEVLKVSNALKKRISDLENRIDLHKYVKTADLDELQQSHAALSAFVIKMLLLHLPLIIETAKFHSGRNLPLNKLIILGIQKFFPALQKFKREGKSGFNVFFRFALMKHLARHLPETEMPPKKSLKKNNANKIGDKEREKAYSETMTLLEGMERRAKVEGCSYLVEVAGHYKVSLSSLFQKNGIMP